MIAKEEVQHIAKLARIQLSEKETERFQHDLSQILDYFDILNELDVSGVAPMTHSANLKNVARQDRPKKERPEVVDKLLRMAPDSKQGFLKVKSILQNSDE